MAPLAENSFPGCSKRFLESPVPRDKNHEYTVAPLRSVYKPHDHLQCKSSSLGSRRLVLFIINVTAWGFCVNKINPAGKLTAFIGQEALSLRHYRLVLGSRPRVSIAATNRHEVGGGHLVYTSALLFTT